MAVFEDKYWESADGLKLHYRDYPAIGSASASRAPLICMPGLTRNARDFEPVAELLAKIPGAKRRMIAIDFRGRGDSGYAKDPMNYTPITYMQDVDALLRALQLKSFITLGTSLGGIVSMLLATVWKDKMKGAILNDIGPEIGTKGVERIRGYVGQTRNFETWVHAARSMAEAHGAVYPDFKLNDWLRLAKRTCKLSNNGRIVFDYDMKIAEPFKLPGGEAGVDLWPMFEGMAGVPLLVLRGATSDILEKTVANRMVKKHGDATLVTIPRIGHAPTLDEVEAQEAIKGFLAGVR